MPKVWINTDTIFDKFIVMADDAILSADVKNETIEQTKARIENGEAPLNVLGEKATMIPWFSITKVEVDEHDTDIDIDYKAGKESKSKTLSFIDIDTRKQAFAELQSHMDKKFTCMTDSFNIVRAIYSPLLTLTILAIATWLLHGAAVAIAGGQHADIHGRHSGIKRLFYWALELLGPTGVMVVGGVLMLLAVMSLVKRIKRPPVITTLKEGKQSAGGIVGTLIKYTILAAIWYLFGPGMLAAMTVG